MGPGSKCCKPEGPKSAWYPVSSDTECREVSVQCTNSNGDEFECAEGDACCGDICVGKDDVCCENVVGDSFPCQGNGGGCCGNACHAPGSKCCKSPWVAKARWYPVTMATKCAWGAEENSLLAVHSAQDSSRRRKSSVQCRNDDGTSFECAAGDKCCGGACVGEHDVCCENVNGDSFPCQGEGGGCCGDSCVSKDDVCCENVLGDSFQCQGNGGGCCGNACHAPGSKCCKSPWMAK